MVIVDDGRSRAIFVIPSEAGLQKSRDQMKLVLADFWDFKLELNFVPVYRVSPCGTDRIGYGIEFFDARKLRNCWFFEIYIQGSKYNFLELSLRIKMLR